MVKNILWVTFFHINWELNHFQSAQDPHAKDSQQMYLDSVCMKIVSSPTKDGAFISIAIELQAILWFWKEVLGFMHGHSNSGKANFNTPVKFFGPGTRSYDDVTTNEDFFAENFL